MQCLIPILLVAAGTLRASAAPRASTVIIPGRALGDLTWVSYDIPSEQTRVLTEEVAADPAWRTEQGLGGVSSRDDVLHVHRPPDVIIPVLPAKVTTYRYVDLGIQFTMVDDAASPRDGRINEIGIFRPGRFPKR